MQNEENGAFMRRLVLQKQNDINSARPMGAEYTVTMKQFEENSGFLRNSPSVGHARNPCEDKAWCQNGKSQQTVPSGAGMINALSTAGTA